MRVKHGYDDSQRDDTYNRTTASVLARSKFENQNHDSYYRQQIKAGFLFSEEDWGRAQEWFRKPLPVAFRLNKSCSPSASNFWKLLRSSVSEGALSSSPLLANAYVATIHPREWPESVQKILADAQEVGALHRQELCSMVPAILLDVKPHHLVLDLCSAPGSKSLQILDHMHSSSPTSFPPGLLASNDANHARLMVVARRSRRQPRSNLLLSSSDGRYFPSLRKWGGYKVKFDRVLCDVPCDGDGTLRKLSSSEWSKWNVKHHLSLHKIQCHLLIRALQSVKKGGRVVYSTCTLDPLENEAVVASAIARVGAKTVGGLGEYRIVPPPEFLTKDASEPFRYCPGSTHWVVPHPKFSAEMNTTFETLQQVPPSLRRKDILPSMFPPGTKRIPEYVVDDVDDDDIRAERLTRALEYGDVLQDQDIAHLEAMLPHCCRILPHHMDSGGFFCAIIERAAPAYYALFCPRRRSVDLTMVNHDNSMPSSSRRQDDVHGRIFFPVDSNQQIRDLIGRRNSGDDEIRYEGFSSIEAAQRFLKQHGGYVDGISENSVPLPASLMRGEDEEEVEHDTDAGGGGDGDDVGRTTDDSVAIKKTYLKPAKYTPMYKAPHASLTMEFCNFFGLHPDAEAAERAGVQRFPIENMVVVGSANATNAESCRWDDDPAHEIVMIHSTKDSKGKLLESLPHYHHHRKHRPRFFQLCLLSEEIQSLHSGGAKFTAIEAGTGREVDF